jgi:hypothetical protein
MPLLTYFPQGGGEALGKTYGKNKGVWAKVENIDELWPLKKGANALLLHEVFALKIIRLQPVAGTSGFYVNML